MRFAVAAMGWGRTQDAHHLRCAGAAGIHEDEVGALLTTFVRDSSRGHEGEGGLLPVGSTCSSSISFYRKQTRTGSCRRACWRSRKNRRSPASSREGHRRPHRHKVGAGAGADPPPPPRPRPSMGDGWAHPSISGGREVAGGGSTGSTAGLERNRRGSTASGSGGIGVGEEPGEWSSGQGGEGRGGGAGGGVVGVAGGGGVVGRGGEATASLVVYIYTERESSRG